MHYLTHLNTFNDEEEIASRVEIDHTISILFVSHIAIDTLKSSGVATKNYVQNEELIVRGNESTALYPLDCSISHRSPTIETYQQLNVYAATAIKSFKNSQVDNCEVWRTAYNYKKQNPAAKLTSFKNTRNTFLT